MKKTIVKVLLLNLIVFGGFAWYVITQPLATKMPVNDMAKLYNPTSRKGEEVKFDIKNTTKAYRTNKSAVSAENSFSGIGSTALPYTDYSVNPMSENNRSKTSGEYYRFSGATVTSTALPMYAARKNNRNESNNASVRMNQFPLIVQNTATKPLSGGVTTLETNSALNEAETDPTSDIPDRQKNPPFDEPVGEGLILLIVLGLVYARYFVKSK